MSISQQLGPYLKINTKKITEQVVFESCSNVACKFHKKDLSLNFCSTCGSPKGKNSRDVIKDEVNSDQLFYYDLKEVLTPCNELRQNNAIIVQANRSNPKGIKYNVDDKVVHEISGEQRTEDLTWFTETFKDEIAKIKQAYGSENVSLCWGLLSYYS